MSVFRHWLTRGFWAISDQGLFAISNFVLNVLLARWLTPQDYGAFVVAFTVFLIILAFHIAVLTEPMMVFGSGRYKARLSEYLGALLYGHLIFAVSSGFVLLLVGLVFALSGSSAVATVLVALALAGPFMSLLWLMRRACYTRFEPHLATLGGALYMVLMLAGAYALYRLEWLSAASAFGVMGISSLVVSFWLAVRLRIGRPPLRGGKMVREAFGSHWRYGRWSTATTALGSVPLGIYFLLLPVWGGLEASAALRALVNLVMPMVQTNTALSALLLPSLVRAREGAGLGPLMRTAQFFFVLIPALYWVMLGVFHYPLITLLYGGQYTEHANLLWLLGLWPIAEGITSVAGGSLKALERPDKVFWAFALSASAALTLGVWSVFSWGIVGAAVGLLMSSGLVATALLFFSRRLRRSNFSQEGRNVAGNG